MLRVLPPMVKPVSNLICCKTGFMWVVKRATSLFDSFCSNVAKQVAGFFVARFSVPLPLTYIFIERLATPQEKPVYEAILRLVCNLHRSVVTPCAKVNANLAQTPTREQ